MQTLTAEETRAMLVKLGPIHSSTNPIFNKILMLKPGEALVVPRHEFTGKSRLGGLLRPRAIREGIKISCRELPNGEGWIIVREPEE